MNNERYNLIDIGYGYIVVDEWLARDMRYNEREYEYDRRDDAVGVTKPKVFYGKVGGLGYIVADDELEEYKVE